MLAELVKFDVDSEVFELTVAMLKQKDEVKYQTLIDLLFEKATDEFTNNQHDYTAFNILILSMQVVDDVLYKNRLLDLIVTYKDIILRDISVIHNMRLLESIYKDDQQAYEALSEAYCCEAMMVLLQNFDRVSYFFSEFADDKGKELSRALSSKDFSMMVKRRFSFDHTQNDKHFYFKIFIKLHDPRILLSEISDETVLGVYRKLSRRNYRKKTAHFRTVLGRILNMPPEDQKAIIELIASMDFIMYYSGD